MRLLTVLILAFASFPVVEAAAATVRVHGSVRTVLPSESFSTSTNSASINMAQNEFESFQLAISAGSSELRAVDVRLAGPLRTTAGHTLAASNVTIYRQEYYNVATPSDGELGGQTGRFPDALIPRVDPFYGEQRNAFPISVPAGENRMAWIDVFAPQGQAPGHYEGTLEVRGEGYSHDLALRVRVLPFSLPSTSSIKGGFDMNAHAPCAVHGCATDEAGWHLNALYAQAALDNRVTIGNPAKGTPNPASPAMFRKHVVPLFTGTAPTRLVGAQLTNAFIFQWCASCTAGWKSEAARAGFADRLTFHCDELSNSAAMWDACRRDYQTASAQWNATAPSMGKLPLHATVARSNYDWATANGFTDIAWAMDTLVPVVNRMHDKVGEAAGNQRESYNQFLNARSGRSLWMYQSCMSHGCVDDEYRLSSYWNGWPSYAIDQPGSEARAMPWLLFSYRTSGEYYFESVKKLSSAWTDQYSEGGNGDGTLLYPGLAAGKAGVPAIGGTHDIPIESIRLKRIRDGREDFEYLHYLAERGHRDSAAAIAADLFASAHDTNRTHNQVRDARWNLAKAIMAIQSGAPLPARTPQSAPSAPQPTAPKPAPTPRPSTPRSDPVPTCAGHAATIVGTSGPDVLRGTPARDVIVAAGGADQISSGGGDDVICGGSGLDMVNAGAGNDFIDGQGGRDTLDYRRSAARVVARLGSTTRPGTVTGEGKDTVIAMENVIGSRANDILVGGPEFNYMEGGPGNDVLQGRGGDDFIEGGYGVDRIDGGAGLDRVYGGPGRDIVAAADGVRDVVVCGAGIDSASLERRDRHADCERRVTRRTLLRLMRARVR